MRLSQIFVDFMNMLEDLIPDIFSVLPAECISGDRLYATKSEHVCTGCCAAGLAPALQSLTRVCPRSGFYFEMATTLALPWVVLLLTLGVVLFARMLTYCCGYGLGPDCDNIFASDDGIDALIAATGNRDVVLGADGELKKKAANEVCVMTPRDEHRRCCECCIAAAGEHCPMPLP